MIASHQLPLLALVGWVIEIEPQWAQAPDPFLGAASKVS